MYEDSEASFLRAIELDSDDIYAYNGLGDVYRLQDKYREAIREYDRSLKLYQADSHALFHKALCHNALEEGHLAHKALDRLLDFEDQDFWIDKAEALKKSIRNA
jgi:tetratricopeptide (TPR) repeat protein